MMRSVVTQAHAEEVFPSRSLSQHPSALSFVKQEKDPNMCVSVTPREAAVAAEPRTSDPNTNKRSPPKVTVLPLSHGKSAFALCWCSLREPFYKPMLH